MTEALKNWSFKKLGHYGEHEAEFWIRSFCEELEERIRENNRNPEGYSKMMAIGFIYQDLKDELLGRKPL